MAGDWIKVEHALSDKPEVFRIAEILGIDPDAVVGKLVRFWSWCDQQTVNGNALGVTDSFLDRITHQPGFSDALRKVDWLLARSGSLAVPHFDRHNGQTAKARAVTNRRVAKHRGESNAVSVTDVTPQPLQKPLPEKRREEYKEAHTQSAGETTEEPVAPALLGMGAEGQQDRSPDLAPTLGEVKTYAQTAGVGLDCAEKWWNEMEGVGWINRHGQPIRKWRNLLLSYGATWRANEHQRAQQGKRGYVAPPPKPEGPPKPLGADFADFLTEYPEYAEAAKDWKTNKELPLSVKEDFARWKMNRKQIAQG